MEAIAEHSSDDISGVSVKVSNKSATVFEGIVAKTRVNLETMESKPVRRPPSWSRAGNIRFVVGQTLERISVASISNREIKGYIHKPSDEQLRTHCDTCKRHHRPKNRLCSANLKLRTFAKKRGYLYDIETRMPFGKWKVDATYLNHSTSAEVTCSK